VLTDVIGSLRCPVCRGPLELSRPTAVTCPDGHLFDVARQGYLNLLGGGRGTGSGDDAAMVDARSRFLAAGHYAPLTAAVADLVADAVAGPAASPVADVVRLLDAGAGPGHYLAATLDRAGGVGLALDLSRYAARRAARAHPLIGAVVADTWQELPVRDRAVDAVLDVFAPRNAPEFHRVLRPGGALVLVTPTAGHLGELIRPLRLVGVDGRKDDRVEAALDPLFTLAEQQRYEFPLVLSHDEVAGLVLMGPSARHHDPATVRARIAELLQAPTSVTASVTVGWWRRRD
jgi:23S rRNA (guanine745-N1)-methyltransferase